jgi:Secretion system C-terminal sorting domain
MKKILLLAFILPFVSFSQTKTTTQNGDFYNPLTWDCVCLPANGDDLIINHAVVMNLDIYYNLGTITINANGSLSEDATERNFWADGTGTITNHGTFTTHAVYISPGASMTNTGSIVDLDSLWHQGTVTNSGSAALFDFWNDQTGTFTNTGDLANADSLLNQGTFTNDGTATVYDFGNDQMATFTSSVDLLVTNNMNNQGYGLNTGNIEISNDFSNCNTQSMDAMFINDGIFCVTNDFINCLGDTLAGSGDYYIGGSSSNFGVFDGTHTFHTPSGTIGVPGTIEAGVNVIIGACDLSVLPIDLGKLSIYPNPTTSIVVVSQNDIDYKVFDVSGRLMLSGTVENNTIDFTTLTEGLYTIIVGNSAAQRVVKQ